MYSLRKKRDPSSNRYSIKQKPTWASHIPTEDPEKARPTAQPSGPMVQQSVNQCPSTPVGPAGRAQPADSRCSPRAGGRGMLCVRKRGMKAMCSSTRGTCQRPPTDTPWAW